MEKGRRVERGERGNVVFTNPDKESGRHVGEKRSGIVYRFPRYLTTRLDSEIYLVPVLFLVSHLRRNEPSAPPFKSNQYTCFGKLFSTRFFVFSSFNSVVSNDIREMY